MATPLRDSVTYTLQPPTSALQSLREQLNREKQVLSDPYNGISPYLTPDNSYCLLPAPWLATWRAHLNLGHKDPSAQPPTCLAQAMEGLICRDHDHLQPHLAYAVPMAVKKYSHPHPIGSSVEFVNLIH